MGKPLVSNQLWEVVKPLVTRPRAYPKGGRPPIDDRAALTGILFVLSTGLRWQDLPAELGCGSGMTCWRRWHEWSEQGVWEDVQSAIVAHHPQARKFDWERLHSRTNRRRPSVAQAPKASS